MAADRPAAPDTRPQPSHDRADRARVAGRWATLSIVTFEADVLARLDRAGEIEIETRARDGQTHRTIIWVVVDDGAAFVRSYRGPTARWYREALANPAVALHVAGRRLAATAVPATDPDSIARTSNALTVKYAAEPATPAMVAPDVLHTTLRLVPA